VESNVDFETATETLSLTAMRIWRSFPKFPAVQTLWEGLCVVQRWNLQRARLRAHFCSYFGC